MPENHPPDYSSLDRPEVLSRLFHPRPDYGHAPSRSHSRELMIPVDGDVAVGACFHVKASSDPNILFFHGNGEIVADYTDLGRLFNQAGINLLAVDYRGYGRSSGRPTVATMMTDCHRILDWSVDWLTRNNFTGSLVVMGRSLGSASALELAVRHPQTVAGLIVESGFAFAAPLLKLLGVSPTAVGFREEEGFSHLDKISRIDKPTLIIHAEFDHIIPFSDGQSLYDASPSKAKSLLMIPGANHNDIFARGLPEYLGAIKSFVQKLSR